MSSSKSEKKMYPVFIPVKPHVKQFLDFHCGENYQLSFSSYLGPQILTILYNQFEKSEVMIDDKDYSEKYKIMVGGRYFFHRRANRFTNYQIMVFNRMIIEQFNDRMVDFVATMEMMGINNKQSILHWCDRYQLDDGSTDWYQWFKKEYYRKRDKYLKNLKKPWSDLSPEIKIQKHTLAS